MIDVLCNCLTFQVYFRTAAKTVPPDFSDRYAFVKGSQHDDDKYHPSVFHFHNQMYLDDRKLVSSSNIRECECIVSLLGRVSDLIASTLSTAKINLKVNTKKLS